jgi:hypothetical protein
MDTSKNQQAIEIIVAQIANLPANTPMDHGTLGHFQGLTQREGQANDMAKTFVMMLTGINFNGLPETWTAEQNEAYAAVKEIAAAAVAKAGR